MPATLFCLHALGSSAREFDPLRERLAGTVEVVGVDLAGFGDASAATGTTVEEMANAVERVIGRHGATEWGLLGHSMGGKVASVVASRTLDGSNGLFGLRAVVLLAASPLSPEPMDESRREQMLAWADGHPIDEDDARTFVDANTDDDLAPDADAAAIADVRRAAPEAWIDWLRRGSNEDWSSTFPSNPAPALILAGAADGDLGEDAQRAVNLPHWTAGELDVVPGAAHLLPLEQPDAVADRIRSFWQRRVTGPVVPADTARTIASPRTSARTRGILAARALPDDPDRAPVALDRAQLDTLRAVARVVVPQDGPAIDLASRVDAQLAAGAGDGWRADGMPDDLTASRTALDALAPEAARGDEHLADVLEAVATGSWTPASGAFNAGAMQTWFEDASVDLTRQWLAHPATMADIDYDGFANGGDGVRKQGFQILAADTREAWEPTGATR